nr:hypothetical protein Iba_chr06aCG17740 [Ipomoea batatas]
MKLLLKMKLLLWMKLLISFFLQVLKILISRTLKALFAPTMEGMSYFNEADESAADAANTPSTSRQTKANTQKNVRPEIDGQKDTEFSRYIDNVFENVKESVETSLLTATPTALDIIATEEMKLLISFFLQVLKILISRTLKALFAPTMEGVSYFNEADESAADATNTPSTSLQTKANTQKNVRPEIDGQKDTEFSRYIDNVFGNVKESVEASLLTTTPTASDIIATEEVIVYFNEADAASAAYKAANDDEVATEDEAAGVDEVADRLSSASQNKQSKSQPQDSTSLHSAGHRLFNPHIVHNGPTERAHIIGPRVVVNAIECNSRALCLGCEVDIRGLEGGVGIRSVMDVLGLVACKGHHC